MADPWRRYLCPEEAIGIETPGEMIVRQARGGPITRTHSDVGAFLREPWSALLRHIEALVTVRGLTKTAMMNIES